MSNGSALSKPITTAIEAELGVTAENGPWSDYVDAPSFLNALTLAGQDRLKQFSQGVQAYHSHPHRRSMQKPVPWKGPATLPVVGYGGDDQGLPVLVVPSLINRAFVLDLYEDRSFMRSLAANGCRSYLLDWTAPGACSPGSPLTTYINTILIPALATLREMHGRPAVLIGYCMGGTLTVAPAARHPDLVAGLVLLAAPWDFHADTHGLRHWLSQWRPGLESTIDIVGHAPVDLLQSLFAGLDPMLVGRKFRSFAAMDPDSDEAKRFVVLEDWLNDGVPLSGPVAHECLFDWYLENTPYKGTWRIGDDVINPQDIICPTLAVIPERDRIVPPQSARALADAIPGTDVRSVALSHIGMITGGRAAQEVYEPVAAWIKNAASQ